MLNIILIIIVILIFRFMFLYLQCRKTNNKSNSLNALAMSINNKYYKVRVLVLLSNSTSVQDDFCVHADNMNEAVCVAFSVARARNNTKPSAKFVAVTWYNVTCVPLHHLKSLFLKRPVLPREKVDTKICAYQFCAHKPLAFTQVWL